MATSAHTEVPGGGRGAFPPFQKDTFASQLLWLVIAFVALYLLMAKVALPRIGAIMAARRDCVADDLAQANRYKQEAETALAAYEKALAEARGRAQGVAGEARERLQRETEATRRALEEKLNAKLGEAERAIAASKNAALANVRVIAVEAAAAIVEQLIGVSPARTAVEDAVADSLKR